MSTWVERLEIMEELRRSRQGHLVRRQSNEHERHLRESGGIGGFGSLESVFYPDPYTDRLLDFNEHLKQHYKERKRT
jgi:hypothetical protein